MKRTNDTKLMPNKSNITPLFGNDKDDDDDEIYELTPKGIAIMAMLQTGLVRNSDDPRIEGFWTIFAKTMIEEGYVQNE